ncbi:trypsin-like peptidase domain-containing protein [Micromonospora sp. WMMD812]|uniref:trypsin-like peptidase domain-containing protein n=1 Tax=Micromonospora sp. WMMD812 TaxID=3015152 RepID=UPI00248B90E2|nr:trypsin-like peptidase domain-containing protein [Micromonospora sp. WMMD812]WBB69102.1 trypsin-like peptidase domain-containing protein [Micromonospora sp. WMMD812]
MPHSPRDHLVDLARECAVRIEDDAGGFLGSGFFVASGHVMTCAHVVEGMTAGRLRVGWSNARLQVSEAVCVPEHAGAGRTYEVPDLALLKVDAPPGHPIVWLSRSAPSAWTQAMAIGFSRQTPATHPAADTATFQVVGSSAPPLLKVRDGRIPAGMSGSLVLDMNAGSVCGVVKAATDDPGSPEGWILPSQHACAAFDGLAEANAQRHPRGSAWWKLATHRAALARRLFGIAYPARTPEPPSDPPPSWWLDPRHRVVSFLPRPELDVLTAFAADEAASAPMIRLLRGPGGSGKTRLALELADRLFGQGWVAGVRQPPEAEDVRRLADMIQEATDLGHRVLVAFDYVEGYRTELERLAEAVAPDAVRFLLLARSAGTWWTRFSPGGEARYRINREPIVLGLPGDGPDGTKAAFTVALRTFREHMGSARPDGEAGSELVRRAAGCRDMLTLHAAALVSAIHERDHGSLPVASASWADSLDELVRHEQRHLERAGRRLRLDCDPDLTGEALLLPSLFAARNAAQAGEVVGRLSAIAGPQVRPLAGLLHELYPNSTALRWWAPLPLDRLAETLLAQVVEDALDGPAYLGAVFASSAVWQAVDGLVLLLRVATDDSVPEAIRRQVDAGLDTVVRARGFLLLAALWVAETRVHGEAPRTSRYVAGLSAADALGRVEDLRRSGRRSLQEFALVLLDRAEEAARQAPRRDSLVTRIVGGERPALPPMLVILRAMILVQLERYAEAISLAGGLIPDLRADVAARAAENVPPEQPLFRIGMRGDRLHLLASEGDGSEILAMALQVHAAALEGDEQDGAALTLRAEACEVARRGSIWNRDLARRLIYYLCELAEKHSNRGDASAAESLLVEAAERARAQLEDTPKTPLVLLARLFDRQGRHDEAAVLQRQLGGEADGIEPDPEAAVFEEVTAGWRRSVELAGRGLLAEARSAAQVYLNALRDLADEDPQTYTEHLPLFLCQAAELELPRDKLDLYGEAIRVLRMKARATPPDLHMLGLVHLNLADCLIDLDRPEEAMAAATEAVRYFDRYAEHAPGKTASRLITALHIVAQTAPRAGRPDLAAEAARRADELVRQHEGDPRLQNLVAVQMLRFQELEKLRAAAQEATEAGMAERAAELLRQASVIGRDMLGWRMSAQNRKAWAARLLAIALGLLRAGDNEEADRAVDDIIRSEPSLLAHSARVHIRRGHAAFPDVVEAVDGLLRACREAGETGERRLIDEAVQWVQYLAHRPEAAEHQDAIVGLLLGVLPLPVDAKAAIRALLGVVERVTEDDLPSDAGPALCAVVRRHDDPVLAHLVSTVAVKVPLDARHAVYTELDAVIRTWSDAVREERWTVVAMIPWLRSQALSAAGRHDEAASALIEAVPWVDAHCEQDADMFRVVVRGYLRACRDAGRPQDAVDTIGALSAESLAMLMASATARAEVLGWQAETAGRLGYDERARLTAAALAAAYDSGEMTVIHRAHRDHARAVGLRDTFDPDAFAHLIASGVVGVGLGAPFDVGLAANSLNLQLCWHDVGTVAGLARRVDIIDGVRFGEAIVPALSENAQRMLDRVLDAVVTQCGPGLVELTAVRMQWDPYIAAVVQARRGVAGWLRGLHRLLPDYIGTDWEAVAHAYTLLAEGHDEAALDVAVDGTDQVLIARCRNAVRGRVRIDADLAFAMPVALLFRHVFVASQGGPADEVEALLTQLDGSEPWSDLVARLRALLGGSRDRRLAETPDDTHRAVMNMLLDAIPGEDNRDRS